MADGVGIRDTAVERGRSFAVPVPLAADATALIVVDVQHVHASRDEGFGLAFERVHPGSCNAYNDRVEQSVLPSIVRLLEGFRAARMPIVFLTLGSDDRELKDLAPRQSAAVRVLEQASGVHDLMWTGSTWARIREEVAPLPGELVLNKTTFGAFNSTDLDRLLAARAIRSLVFAGVTTSCCVETTARDAADRGYGCVLVESALADYEQEAHEATLVTFRRTFGRVVASPEDVFLSLGKEVV